VHVPPGAHPTETLRVARNAMVAAAALIMKSEENMGKLIQLLVEK
jgi:hypothetical protein